MGDLTTGFQRTLSAATIVAVLALGACATPPEDTEALEAYREANDPIEPFNRWIFSLNQHLDKLILRPVTLIYRFIPETPRQGVTNFLRNLDSPVILANDIFQGKFRRAGTTAGRFITNSTVGIGGIFDIATNFGLERHSEDFGQTLGYWGVSSGPYLVLPLIGPAPPREALGRVVDYFLDPISYIADNSERWEWIPPTRVALKAIDFRSRNFDQIDEIERTSIDLYATVRSAYRQSRSDDIRDGAPGPLIPVPQISSDYSDEETAAVDTE